MINATKSNELPIVWHKTYGAYVEDCNEIKYLDFTSAIFVTNCGHDAVAKAIKKQADKVIHSYTFDTIIRDDYIISLKKFLPDFCDRIYLASAGSEVTSWAIKLMRTYKKKKIIVHFEGAFHGKTGLAGKLENEELILPFPDTASMWPDAYNTLAKYKDDLAGIMVEAYRGWDSRFISAPYMQNLNSFCKKFDIPLCFDEIQSGFYRTGKKFCYENYLDTEPDLMCLGKAIGGGMPLSALVGREKHFTFDDMSSTHSGHPICCAAGLAVINWFKDMDIYEYEAKCKLFEERMFRFQNYFKEVKEVNAKGMVGALIFDSKELANKVTQQSAKEALLLVNTGKTSVKIGPPLCISMKELSRGFDIIETVLRNLQ